MSYFDNIDWDTTKKRFNIDQLSIGISNKKVIYRCPSCLVSKEITYKEIKRKKYAECIKCIPKHTSAKISRTAKNNYTAERKKELSESAKKNWLRCKDAINAGREKLWQDDEFRKKKSIECTERNRKMWANNKDELIVKIKESFTNEITAQQSATSLELWGDSTYRSKTLSAIRSDENRALISKLSRNTWLNQEYREKMALIRASQSGKQSRLEIQLSDMLDDLDIKYIEQYPCGFYVFDFFLSDHNILIECNGDYWHSFDSTKCKDASKATYIERYFSKYSLKTIWEHEFLCGNRIIELLKYWTGNNYIIENFNFKDLDIVIIDKKDARLFLDKYHYAGIGHGKLYLGAKLRDKLVAVCVFGQLTRNESASRLGYTYYQVRELSRFCIHPKYQKHNLASYLLSKFVKFVPHNIQCLISFADETHNHTGTIYKASGWHFDGEVQPSYWYADNDGYVMHKKTLWNHAVKMGMKEAEWAKENGYIKVWGKKKRRFILKLSG